MERRGGQSAAGPEDHQAALVMGNTVRAWTAFYDRFYVRREAQLGVDTMSTWREQLLQRQTAIVQVPVALMQEVQTEQILADFRSANWEEASASETETETSEDEGDICIDCESGEEQEVHASVQVVL